MDLHAIRNILPLVMEFKIGVTLPALDHMTAMKNAGTYVLL